MSRLTQLLFAAITFAAIPTFAQHPMDHQHDGADPGDQATASDRADVEVDVLGMVCDFCAISMEKTFAKREEVADVSVDLGAKVLRIVFKEGETLDDPTIERLIKKAGYKTEAIRRQAS